MAINRELNESELSNVFGGDVRAENLPSKFKTYIDDNGEIVRDSNYKGETILDDDIPTFNPPDELSIEELESTYGGPINPDDLPDGFLKRH